MAPNIGARICLAGHLGTIRYVGLVDGTQGVWLGIEWDDQSRGKHDGVRDGRRIPGSGSFIRPSSSLCYGQSFLQALVSKYVENPLNSVHKETVILGSSNGAIEVEAVGLDKIRGKLAQLERLREASLDTEYVASADPSPEIHNTCPNLQSLDLSSSLLSSWDIVALIAAQLPKLQTLSLNRSRFAPVPDVSRTALAFKSLKELRLNRTMTLWPDMVLLLSSMPELRYLELGYNQLKLLGTSTTCVGLHLSKLELLNLDGNELRNWVDIMTCVRPFPNLRRIVLTSNRISAIPSLGTNDPIRDVRHLGLNSNHLGRWSDVDALCTWLPELETLIMSENPLVTDHGDFRQLTVARIPSLMSLNSATISPKERNDSELFYLSQIAQSNLISDETRSRKHPQWMRLCEKHGKPEAATLQKDRDTLGHRLIDITVHLADSAPSDNATALKQFSEQLPPALTLRVLPTMTLRILRLKLSKCFAAAGASRRRQIDVQVWLLMDNGVVLLDEDLRDLTWWGIQSRTVIVACLKDRQ